MRRSPGRCRDLHWAGSSSYPRLAGYGTQRCWAISLVLVGLPGGERLEVDEPFGTAACFATPGVMAKHEPWRGRSGGLAAHDRVADRVQAAEGRTLAYMHGRAWTGGGAKLLMELADALGAP
jgi:hypothetical protein